MNIEVMTGLTRPQVDALISEVALSGPDALADQAVSAGPGRLGGDRAILLRKNWTQDEAAAVDCSSPTSPAVELLRGPIAAAFRVVRASPRPRPSTATPVLIDGTPAR